VKLVIRLELSDDGSPNLYACRRVIINVKMTGYMAMRGSLDPDPDSVGMTIKSPRSRLNSLAKIVTHMRKHLAASGINNDPAAASAIRETRDLHSLLPSLHAGGDTFDCSMGRWFHEVLPSHYKQCHLLPRVWNPLAPVANPANIPVS
jgi:hypothetical protein